MDLIIGRVACGAGFLRQMQREWESQRIASQEKKKTSISSSLPTIKNRIIKLFCQSVSLASRGLSAKAKVEGSTLSFDLHLF